MKKRSYFLLIIFGFLLLLFALIFGLLSLSSLAERSKYGGGLLFTDVEIFGFIGIVCLLGCIILFLVAKSVKKRIDKVE